MTSLPEEIKRDWRLPIYLLAVAILLLCSLIFIVLPFFQVYQLVDGMVVTNVVGYLAYFGGTGDFTYYPLYFGILAEVLIIIAALSALAFSLLLKLRRTDGKRRFSLVIVSLSSNLAALILLFSSVISFIDINSLDAMSFGARYHVGLILQAIMILSAAFIQWFFFIKIRHFIK